MTKKAKKNPKLSSNQINTIITAVIITIVVAVGIYSLSASRAASIQKTIGSCSLSKNSAGEIIASGNNLKANTQYQWELYQNGGGSVGGNQFTTDSVGSFSLDLGSANWYITNFGSGGSISETFYSYPIMGNKANLNTIVDSCSNTF